MKRFFILILLFSLLRALPAQEWQNLLEERPVYPTLTPAQVLDESREERVLRIGTWETAMQNWVAQIAELRQMPLTVTHPTDPENPPEPGDPVAPENLRIVDFDGNGNPVYAGDSNVNAAISTNTRNVRDVPQPLLDGSGEKVAMWESGTPLPTHQEFSASEGNTRIRVVDGGSTSDHATHVAGTIGASGIDSDAKGMAFRVLIDTYDITSFLSEMDADAPTAADQFTTWSISNHSWGQKPGWRWQEIQGDPNNNSAWHWDARLNESLSADFGRYSSRPAQIDEHVFRFPHHLIVVSAGNERSNNPANGSTIYHRDNAGNWTSKTYQAGVDPDGDGIRKDGWDTIANWGISKNVLSVGNYTDAVNGSLRDITATAPNGSTSYGPADDGRIKPDVVANGTSLYSSTSNSDTSYGNKSGTSMASPNVTGTAVLLQEYKRTFFPYERFSAAELKGLLIHSADDIENVGPDYSSGWGLVNAVSATYVMKEAFASSQNYRFISEDMSSTNDEKVYSIPIESSDTLSFKATLVWTDPPGSATNADDDDTPKLVHDLDLRIVGPQGNTFEPYIKSLNNPDEPATTGDNTLDNVEQVRIENAPTGTYTLHVTMKGSMTTPTQPFTLWVSPELDPLTIATPNYRFSAAGGTETQVVASDGEWSFPIMPSWITLDTYTGIGNGGTAVSASPNLSPSNREGFVTLASKDTRGEISFRVRQEAYNPTPGLTLPDVLEQPNWTFTTSPGSPWTAQDVVSSGDGDSAISGGPGDNGTSWMRTTVEGPGRVTFDYKVDSESDHDQLFFRLNGSIYLWTEGTGNPWQTFTIALDDGPNQLEWSYEKDASVSAGADRAWIDNIRFDRIELSATSLTPGSEGQETGIDVDLTIESGADDDWEITNVPSWITVWAQGGVQWGDRTLQVDIAPNLSLEDRSGTFYVGTPPSEFGRQSVEVLQESAQSREMEVDAAANLPGATFLPQAGNANWTGISGAGEEGADAIVAAGQEKQTEAVLKMQINGPGLLAFTTSGELAGDDFFGYALNGQWSSDVLANGRDSSGVLRKNQKVIYLPAGTNTLTWNYTKDGPETFDDYVMIENFQFLSVQLSPTELGLLPREGWQGVISISGLDPTKGWELVTFIGVRFGSLSGTGDAEVPMEVVPNTQENTRFNTVTVRFEGFPDYKMRLEQPGADKVAVNLALDLPGQNVFKSGGNIIGQNVFTRDGIDAVVLGHEYNSNSFGFNINGPAVVTFDVQLDKAADQTAALTFSVDLADQATWTEDTDSWHSFRVELPAGPDPYYLRWTLDNRDAYAFVDRVRVETPLTGVGGELRSLDGSGGELNLPLTSTPSTAPVGSDPWMTPSFSDGILHIKLDPLPGGMNARVGMVTVDGETLQILQIRPEVIEPGYLTAVGAANLEEVLLDPLNHPLGDLDSDGNLNALEWTFGTLGQSGEELFNVLPPGNGLLRVGFKHRSSPWANLGLGLNGDLQAAWTRVTFENGTWTPAGTAAVTEIDRVPQPDGTTRFILDLEDTEQPGNPTFLRGSLLFE